MVCAGESGVDGAAFSPALVETEAVAVHLQDVDVVGEAVEQRAGEPFRAEDFGPFGEGQIAGDHGRAPLVALAEHLEEQFGAGFRQRHEVQFVDDEQFVAGDLLLEAQQLLLIASLDQLTDQGGSGGEANAVAMLAGGQAEGQRDMRLTGAGVAEQQHVLVAPQELTARPVPAPSPY